MGVRFYKALWGMEGELEDQLAKVRAAGFDGIEAPVRQEALPFGRAIKNEGLGYVGMLFIENPDELSAQLDKALESGALLVNIHSGKDWWNFDDGCRFFEQVLKAQQDCPVPVAHETHRGRLLFNPATTAAYLRKFPELRITADFSHWTCVCESLLQDQEESMALACDRTIYIHARVGYEQGPQVPDPRTPEWERYVQHFESWWDEIRRKTLGRGVATLRVDPEFGPPEYMHTLPHSREPVADLWDVCVWMRDRLKARWDD